MSKTEFDPNRAYQQLIDKGSDWAEKNAKAQHWEEMRRPLRSQLVVGLLREGMAIGKAEHLAQAKEEYEEHIIQMVNARREANKARVDYDAAKVLAEMRRTEAANNRAEMKLA